MRIRSSARLRRACCSVFVFGRKRVTVSFKNPPSRNWFCGASQARLAVPGGTTAVVQRFRRPSRALTDYSDANPTYTQTYTIQACRAHKS